MLHASEQWLQIEERCCGQKKSRYFLMVVKREGEVLVNEGMEGTFCEHQAAIQKERDSGRRERR